MLEEMLAAKGSRFSDVYVHGSLSGDMYVSGPVGSGEDVAELQSEMVTRLGQQVGRTVHLNVWVPNLNHSLKSLLEQTRTLTLGGQDDLKSGLAGTTRPTQEK